MIHRIPVNQTLVDGSKLRLDDTIILSGAYAVTPYFKNLDRVTITNDGPVHLRSSAKFDNCRNFKLLGNRKDVFKISAIQSGASGIAVYNRSTDVEIAFLEIEDCGFSGIMIKDDGATRLSGFVMQNVLVHHNKISKTGGEPIYIGETKATGHDLKHVHVYDNILTDGGWDGIQVANVVEDCSIHHNKITRMGIKAILPKDRPQDNGIQIGERTKARVYKNVIRDVVGNGIIVMGTGCDIYENRIYRCGESGIFADSRPDTTQAHTFRINEIVLPKMFGIAVRDTFKKKLIAVAAHNTILNPGKQFFENGSEYLNTSLNNYTEYNPFHAEHLMNKP